MPIINEQTMIDMDLDATTLETFVNSTDPTVESRLGLVLNTLSGHLTAMGYKVPVAYTSGLNITLPTETVDEAGVVYAPLPTSLPISSTPVTFDPDDWYPVQIANERVLLSLYTDFADALSTIGTHGNLVIDANETLAASTYTIPSGVNIITSTGVLTLVGGTTLNVNGTVYGVDDWIDATVGTVAFDNQDLDIRWFGAVAGSDSHVQINAALLAAKTNDLTTRIPAGTWKVGALISLQDDTRLVGESVENTILQASAAISILMSAVNEDRVFISNFQLDVAGFNVTFAVQAKGSGFNMTNVEVYNTTGNDVYDNVTANPTIGLEINGGGGVSDATVDRCSFYDLGMGIKLSNGPENVTIRENKIIRFGRSGILGSGAAKITDNLQIVRNYFADPLGGGVQEKYPIWLNNLTFGYSNTVCSNNVFVGNDFPWRVPATFVDTDPTSFPAATKNDYVYFSADATVDTQSVLEGENWICITTTAGGNAAHWQLTKGSSTDGFVFETMNGLIANDNYIFGSGGSGIALRDDCSDCIVEANHLSSCDLYGVELGTGSTTGTDVLCQGNFMHNCGRDQAANYTNSGGLYLHDLDEGMVTNNKIFCDIVTSEQMPYGIVIEDCTNLTERNNDNRGWLTLSTLESGTNTFTGEQPNPASSGSIDWEANQDGEITLTDATGVLNMPTTIRPGVRPVLRIFGGYVLDVTAFTVMKGMYDSNIGASTLNIARFDFDDAGNGYLTWIHGAPTFTDGTRPVASTVKIGEMMYNTSDNNHNHSDGSSWRLADTGGTT